MIQRIQSIFLVMAAICLGLEFRFPFAKSDSNVPGIFSDGIYNIQDHVVLMGLTAICIILCLLVLFKYQNRALQQRLTYLTISGCVVLILIAILIYYNHLDQIDNSEIVDGAGLYFPIGTIVFLALAIRWIKKDDKLVKSMDRLR